ncbi:MAG: DUF4350 domain-containing protein [Candidatus Thermoplasmatota archaeon]|nr:DUF4350 domain-containing protein [Candidatus Thermoplasmatota archaeon]
MKEVMYRVTAYVIAIAVFFLIFFLAVSAPLVVNDSDFSIYNPGWNGCSDLAVRTREMGSFTSNIELAEGKRTEVTQKELTEYDVEPEKTGMMIIGPRQEFSGESKGFVHDFLRDGGKVVLADDLGSGNSLLDGLDTNSSFHSSPLLDLSFEKKPKFGVAYNTTEHHITDNVSQVMLNEPTAIDKDENATTLLTSSRASWLDKNENRMKDDDESFKQYPLITVESYGEGELILVSDPSIFINSMLDKKDNGPLSVNILDYLSQGRSNLIFDESHREMSFVNTIIYTGEVSNQVAGVLLLFFGIGIGVYHTWTESGDTILKKLKQFLFYFIGEEEGDEPIAKVLNNHPDWDKDKLEMINDRFVKVDKGDEEFGGS